MKQDSMKILFFIRKSKLLKNGEAPIFLRVTVNGQQDEIRIQRSIPVRLWNNQKGCSKEKVGDIPMGKAHFRIRSRMVSPCFPMPQSGTL